jgi:hypothetical protein
MNLDMLRSKISCETNRRGLCEYVWREIPELWCDNCIVHHDSAQEHAALRIQEILAKKSIIKVGHPPYSPDLALCNFWLLQN